MNQKKKRTLRQLMLGAMLMGLGIVIPIVMPAKIVIGPASFTLASHVPVMAAMFFSPYLTVFVALGTAIGFLLAIPVATIWLRALTHLVSMGIGAFVLAKMPDLVNKRVKFQIFNLLLGIFHAALEVLVVWIFYAVGMAPLEPQALLGLLLLIGFGGIIQSMIDFNLAFMLCKFLSKMVNIEIFARAKAKLTMNLAE